MAEREPPMGCFVTPVLTPSADVDPPDTLGPSDALSFPPQNDEGVHIAPIEDHVLVAIQVHVADAGNAVARASGVAIAIRVAVEASIGA